MTQKLTTLLTLFALAWTGLSQADQMKLPTHVPVEKLKWFDTGIGPVKAAVAFGEMATGPYGAFLKFPGGFVSPVHHHSAEYQAVVVKGTIVNSEKGEKDVRMRPGSYWYQRGKASHVTKCVSSSGCTVFLTQPGKFDFLHHEGDKH